MTDALKNPEKSPGNSAAYELGVRHRRTVLRVVADVARTVGLVVAFFFVAWMVTAVAIWIWPDLFYWWNEGG